MRIESGEVCLPLGGAPSTHILKPAVDRFEGVVFNEALCMKVAAAAGLPAAEVETRNVAGVSYLLVKRYDRNIFRIAQHITQNREDAEDVVQDAFLKSYQNLERFQEQSKFYTWLVRIAVNESLMKLRKRRTAKTVSIDEDVQTEEDSVPREVADWSPNPEQLYNQSELQEILGKTIQGLPSSFRTVFVLRDVEGLSTEETAEALDLSVPAVKSRLLRARLQLRERLNRYFKRNGSGDGKREVL